MTEHSAPADVFRKIQGHYTQDSVIDQITFAIRTGVYSPGDKLPTVGELTQLLGVSRPVLGEAVRMLSKAGVIAAQRGNGGGLRVRTSNIPAAMLGLSREESFERLPAILEARHAVEISLAMLCSQRATAEDFRSMEEAVERLIESRQADRMQRRYWDHLFHYHMARAARSEMLAYYQHQILEQLTISLQDHFAEGEDPIEVELLHRETLDALRTKDEALITAAVDKHLAPLERLFGKTTPPDDAASNGEKK